MRHCAQQAGQQASADSQTNHISLSASAVTFTSFGCMTAGRLAAVAETAYRPAGIRLRPQNLQLAALTPSELQADQVTVAACIQLISHMQQQPTAVCSSHRVAAHMQCSASGLTSVWPCDADSVPIAAPGLTTCCCCAFMGARPPKVSDCLQCTGMHRFNNVKPVLAYYHIKPVHHCFLQYSLPA